MVINHLVLSGGGPVGLVEYGILKQLTKLNIISYKNIKSIYATSVGSYIGLIYLLNYEWEWMDDFFIKRPLDKLLENKLSLYNFFYKKGIIDEEIIYKVISPLFLGKNLDVNISLKQFYDLNKVKFNIYVSNITLFKKEVFNYLTNPDIPVIKAITMSMAVPILFQPIYYNNMLYLDGGIFLNTPLDECYLNENCNKDDILLLLNNGKDCIDLSNNFYLENGYNFEDNKDQNNISENSNILEYLLVLIKTLFSNVHYIVNVNMISINNVINVSLQPAVIDIKYWNYVLKNESERSYLIDLGIKQANCFINNKTDLVLDISNITIDSSNITIDMND